MFALSVAVDVNAPGVRPLSRSEVWRGLVMKAENAVPFVPGMAYCTVLERFDDGLLREVSYRGEVLRERITFTPEVDVRFDRVGTPGWVANTISDGPSGLLLTFTFAVRFPGAAPGSPEEAAQGEAMRSAYVGAVAATLDTVRRMAAEGSLR